MRLLLAALTAALLIGPAAAQPVVVPAPGVPGGQVKLVPRDQLRAGPGVKTARLHPKLRAGGWRTSRSRCRPSGTGRRPRAGW
jgi:hypothetical protein